MVLQLLTCFLLLALMATPLLSQSFSPTVLVRDAGGIGDVTARDFNGDGDIDLMIASWWPGAALYYDRATFDSLIRYEVYVSGGSARNLTSGDFDNDGDWDVAIAAWDDEFCALLRNTGSSNPQTLFAVDTVFAQGGGPYAAKAADLNGDGETDLITSELRNATNQVRIFEQLNGSLEEIWLSSLAHDPLGLATADFNGDGTLEVLIAAGQDGGVYVMRHTSIGGYSLSQEIPGFTLTALAAADIDGDGETDIFACDFGADRIRRWEATGTGWAMSLLPGSVTNPRDIELADFDGDGLMDVACTAQGEQNSGGGVFWWRQSAAGTFTIQQITNESNFYGLAVSDYDLDGDLDLLAANVSSQQVVLFRNLMGTPSRIIGTVSSERGGAPIEGVIVTALETGTTGITDAAGRYELGVIEGVFSLRFHHPCWQTMTIVGIETNSEDTTFADAAMQRPVIELPVSSLNVFVQNEIVSTYELWIENSGDAPLHVESEPMSIAPLFPWIDVQPRSLAIQPGESGLFTVTFSPDTLNDGVYDFLGELTLLTNSCPDTVVRIAIHAIVLDSPDRDSRPPLTTRMESAFPNPFNATVTLPVEIGAADHYSISAFDIVGRQVATLHNGYLSPGRMTFQWSAGEYASGTYFVVLKSPRGRWETSIRLIK